MPKPKILHLNSIETDIFSESFLTNKINKIAQSYSEVNEDITFPNILDNYYKNSYILYMDMSKQYKDESKNVNICAMCSQKKQILTQFVLLIIFSI